jgi:hypothetical protein
MDQNNGHEENEETGLTQPVIPPALEPCWTSQQFSRFCLAFETFFIAFRVQSSHQPKMPREEKKRKGEEKLGSEETTYNRAVGPVNSRCQAARELDPLD